jgi:hypothetical protein
MYPEDILAHAYALVKSNQGAPGSQPFWLPDPSIHNPANCSQ